MWADTTSLVTGLHIKHSDTANPLIWEAETHFCVMNGFKDELIWNIIVFCCSVNQLIVWWCLIALLASIEPSVSSYSPCSSRRGQCEYSKFKINRDIVIDDPERPLLAWLLLWNQVLSLPPVYHDLMGPHDDFLPFCEIVSSVRVALCHVSSLSIWSHLPLCFLGNGGGEGRGGGHGSTVLNSLMQFSNATYSFHVSLESFTCEIAKPCLAWATRHSRARVTPKRQMWEGERN